MCFPKKFKNKLEITKNDVVIPDFVWLTYSVCGAEEDSCGWEGWKIEWAAKENSRKDDSSSTGDTTLPADTYQICPNCKKQLFRTEASCKYILAKDQKLKYKGNFEYETIPMKYK